MVAAWLARAEGNFMEATLRRAPNFSTKTANAIDESNMTSAKGQIYLRIMYIGPELCIHAVKLRDIESLLQHTEVFKTHRHVERLAIRGG